MSPLVLLLLASFTAGADATVFYVKNRCPFTVWAAGMLLTKSEGVASGAELAPGMTWPFTVASDATSGKVWARTGCAFDPSTGCGSCVPGDCSGAMCGDVAGKPHMTLAEFTIG